MRWNTHINHLKNKLRKTIYILKHLSYCSNKEVLQSVYYALGESHIRFGITAWGTSGRFTEIQKTQNRLLKILKNAKVNIQPLSIEKIFKLNMIENFYEEQLFRNPIDHCHMTRSKTGGKLKEERFHNTYGKYSLPSCIPKLLNELPYDLLHVENKIKRKRLLRNFFQTSKNVKMI